MNGLSEWLMQCLGERLLLTAKCKEEGVLVDD